MPIDGRCITSRLCKDVVLGWMCLYALAGCGGYDAELLTSSPVMAGSLCGDGKLDAFETCDPAIPSGQPGACPSCDRGSDPCAPKVLVGGACQQQCVVIPITRAENDDMCCPTGEDATTDSDCGSCGDGIVGPRETCDPPESCPTRESCGAELSCIATQYTGSAETCTASCEIAESARCGASDGCCPGDCDSRRDGDCSNGCGDGVVDTGAGERCELKPTDGGSVCPPSCDDGDPCTRDTAMGSAMNCNLACMHTRIRALVSGDGCCPLALVSAAIDSDCSRCGNGRVEGREECDGGNDCSPDCMRINAGTLLHRYSFDGRGTTLVDSVGGADGVVVNGMLANTGTLDLSGGDPIPHGQLPPGILSDAQSVTIEVWVTWGGSPNRTFEHIFDFGSPQMMMNGTEDAVSDTLFVSPSHETERPRLHYRRAGADVARIMLPRAFPENTRVHVAAVFDSERATMILYLDGVAVGSAPWEQSMRDFPDERNWIGRSAYPADPGFLGTVHELRIHGAALSADALRASFMAGPDSGPR